MLWSYTTHRPEASDPPFADIVPLIELVHPEDDPPSLEAQQGYMLIAKGETTEEALAAAGFVVSVDGPLQ